MPTKKAGAPPLVYQLRITLQGILPPIWRSFQVPAAMDLGTVHNVIQIAMGWTDSHLHQFEKDGRYWGEPEHYEFDDIEVIDESRAPLSALLKAEGDSAIYEYDFGDSWRHDVVLEKVLPAETPEIRPVCLGGARHCPPEDVGGVPGYAEFLDVIFDPAHEEYEHLTQWAGGRFQPEQFDKSAVNNALSRLRWPRQRRR